jgi:hypothetical protein
MMNGNSGDLQQRKTWKMNYKTLITAVCTAILFLSWEKVFPQQVADTSYSPEIVKPIYGRGGGPMVFIDEGHNNFHTGEGRYAPFVKLLEKDGFRFASCFGKFTTNKLNSCKILVIANALNEKNVETWALPTPSAFTEDELDAVREWVGNGGSLFLIADHMPMAGAAKDLAAVFGFQFYNGFAFTDNNGSPSVFTRENGTLHRNGITSGRGPYEAVNKVVSFTGQAFKMAPGATPILTLDSTHFMYLPDTAWIFNKKTPKMDVGGWAQGACLQYGKGRVVVFGEAAMFTAQLAGPSQKKVGMNDPRAEDNYKLLLNIMHWLDRRI